MVYYYIVFTIFTIVLTMMMIDLNVTIYLSRLPDFISVKVRRMYWMIRFHPMIYSSPIGKWWMMRKYMKEAKVLMENIEDVQSNPISETSKNNRG